MKDRDNNHRIIGLILYHVVSDFWVAHGEVVLIDLSSLDLEGFAAGCWWRLLASRLIC